MLKNALAVAALFSILGTSAAATEQASPLPERAVTLVVPFAPGGGTDVLARLIAAKLQTAIHQSVIIDNKPGANGIVAIRQVEQAKPDGYTLMFGSSSTHVLAPLISPEKVDIARLRKNFSMVAVVAGTPQVLAVKSTNPSLDLKQFLSNKAAGGMTYGTFGNGSTPHLLGSQLAQKNGLNLVHVPYKGSSAAVTDLLGGQIDAVFLTVAAIDRQVQARQIRALAVSGVSRISSLPQVPTFKELGMEGFDNSGWFAVFAPANTDAQLVTLLHDKLADIMNAPDMQAKLAELGLQKLGGARATDDETWMKTVDNMSRILKTAKIDLGGN